MSGWSLRWKPPGPVAAAFVADRSDLACIMGPVGSGKTSAALIKMVATAFTMRPCLDGVRRAKFLVIRDTYPNLDTTTIKSWHLWVPREVGSFVEEAPRTHEVKLDTASGKVEISVEFRALGDRSVEDALRGWEGTAAYANEADLLPSDILTHLIGRVGRYPNATMGGCSWSGIWFDCNAPDTDNWIYTTFVDKENEDLKGLASIRFFRQPGGRAVDAENVANLPPGYYPRLIAVNARRGEWWVRRFVDNEFGPNREGKPVFPEFGDSRHVAREPLEPIRGLPLIIGVDAGGTPAGVIGQKTAAGQLRGLDELVCPDDETWGPTAFGQRLNALLSEPRYAGWRPDQIRGWGDPSAQYAGQADEAWLDIVGREAGIRFRPAPSNSPAIRLEAVRRPLMRSGEGGSPMTLLSPSMKTLRKGMNSHYRYRRIQVGAGRYADEPEKNHWSHVSDAWQYFALGAGGHVDLMARDGARSALGGTFQASTEFAP